jgi:hypothetical protein
MTGRRGGSVQRCVAASSPERGLAATPGGAREDERGEGGSKTGNGSGLVGLTVGAVVGNASGRAAVARSPV